MHMNAASACVVRALQGEPDATSLSSAGTPAAEPYIWESAGARTGTRRRLAAQPRPHFRGVCGQLVWQLPQQSCRKHCDNGPDDSLDQLSSLRGRSLCLHMQLATCCLRNQYVVISGRT